MAALLLGGPAKTPTTKASPSRTPGVGVGAESARTLPEREDLFRLERFLSLMLVAAGALFLRVHNPYYTTAYMDESIYVVYGRMFLSRHFEAPLDTPLQWSFGWYLWPAMAAIADRIGGLAAVREMAAGLGMVTIAAVYGFTRRVFSSAVAVGVAAVMAVLAPAVLVSRIATRDSGSICFFALGLWAFSRGWRENRKRDWAAAATCFFAAFLCKYLVAIYFPFLVILALWKRTKSSLLFSVPLSVGCAFYAGFHFGDLQHLLRYSAAYGSLRAPAGQAWNIYIGGRWDFWLLVLAAVPTLVVRKWRAAAALLWTGAAVMLLFQWKSRADYDYWKHVNYALIFLVPLGVAGVLSVIERLRKTDYGRMIWGVCAVLVLAGAVGWLGKIQRINEFVFWPNVNPILAYFENRLTPNDRVLVDDTVMRYYFQSTLHQYQITDPTYFHYGENLGEPAYKAAVQDGVFTYVVLDGGMGGEARRMDAAIHPMPGSYQLELAALDPTLGQKIEIYAKPSQPNASERLPSVRLLVPASNTVASSNAGATTADGVAMGMLPRWHAQVEVFTDRWYPQGGDIPIAADGSFHQTIYLSGEGQQQCYHLVRVRLYDQDGEPRAFSLNYGITRANADGSVPACRANP
jgi:uncharacterized membrane protein